MILRLLQLRKPLLNLRSGSGQEYEVIGHLLPGEAVQIISEDGDWYQIKVPEKTGYVYKDYLDKLEEAEESGTIDEEFLTMMLYLMMSSMNDTSSPSESLTPDGNLTLVDDIGSSTEAGKQFITLVTKDGNYFYLIIDRDDDGEEKLRRHIYVENRVKPDNQNGYYVFDAINEAIDTRRKISFFYTDFDMNKQRCPANEGRPYTVSPYTLIWDGDYYYMRSFCDERQEMRNFRVDRIYEQPKILNQIAVMPPDGYNPTKYSRHVFRMFDTDEPVDVQLLCHEVSDR